MKNNLFLIVPSRDSTGLEVDNQEVLACVLSTMSNLFGGATCYNAEGAYLTQNGKVIIEKIIKVESFAENLNNIKELEKLALYVKTTLRQECVAICVNGEMSFI